MLIDPEYEGNRLNLQDDDSLSIKECINIINIEETARSKRLRAYYLSDKDCYCGKFYKDNKSFQEYLRSLGRTDITNKTKAYCPIKLISKAYAEENCIKVEDIPNSLFNNSPIDKYLFNNKAIDFYNSLGDKLSIVNDPNNLDKAFHDYYKGPIKKKETVQRYKANQLRNEYSIKVNTEKGAYIPKTAHEFTLNERGHLRYIKAPSVYDQILQRSINDNLLIPSIRPKLIYDNGASLKGKGVSFCRNRFKYHLQSAYKEFNPNEGYIILMDYSKYFDNIFHNILKEKLSKIIPKEYLDLVNIFIDEFNIDVSYMDDNEYELLKSSVFNSLIYNEYINNNPSIKESLDKSKILERSMGIGNHIAQISGVYYPTRIDNYVTKVKGIRYYGRYMDDTYIILRTKEEAISLLNELYEITKQEGLFINKKKTRIECIHNNWITFLKIKYYITETYKVIEKPVSETFKREYKRLGKFHKLVNVGKMTKDHVIECYRSWRGNYEKFDCGYEILKLDNYVIELFDLGKNYKFQK